MNFIVDDTDLQVKWQDHPVQALYFYRSEMPFQHKMLKIIDTLQQQHPLVYFFAIDTEQFGGLCTRFSLSSVPTLIFLEEGKEIHRVEGTVRTRDFIDVLNDICTR